MKQPGRPVQKATISSNKAALVETIIVLEGTLKGTLAAKEAGILVLHVVYSMCVVSPPPIATTLLTIDSKTVASTSKSRLSL